MQKKSFWSGNYFFFSFICYPHMLSGNMMPYYCMYATVKAKLLDSHQMPNKPPKIPSGGGENLKNYREFFFFNFAHVVICTTTPRNPKEGS